MTKLSQRNSTNTSNANLTAVINPCMKPKRTRKTIPRDSPPQRSSIYRGVTRHRWTGRYEAHLWDKNCWNEAQNKKGRQVYLGAYDDEAAAARAYDLAALKYWGQDTILNFPVSTYLKELLEMDGQSREEYIGSLRRKSSGFSRGVSKYRGVARHHHNGRWEARIGRVFGNKYLYLGTYATQEEAAVAYDMAAIEYRGLNAVTNFDLSRYIKWLRPNNGNNSSYATNNVTMTNNEANNTNLTPCQIIHDAGSSTTQQPPESAIAQPRPTTNATSALSLLLQSSMFKEMVEMTLAKEGPDGDNYYRPHEEEWSYSSEQQPHDQISSAATTSMPEDVKTCFEADDFCGEDFFGDMNSFMQQTPALDQQFDSMINGDDLML